MNPLDKIFIGLGAGILLLITIVIIWLNIANAHLRAELAVANANGTTCHLANDEFQQKVEQQNQAIAVLQNDSALRARHAAEAEQAAAKMAALYQKDAARLTRQKSSGNACAATAALLNSYIAGLK